MPWLSLFIFFLSFFLQRSKGVDTTQALLTAGLAGGATYYTTHQTDWGRVNLGDLDGVAPAPTVPATDVNGVSITSPDGTVLQTTINGTFDTLKSWGATGTSAVIATTSAAAGGIFNQKNLPSLLIGGALLLAILR